MPKLKLKVFKIDQVSFDGECDITFVPTIDGKMGIMYDHTKLITPLKNGHVEIRNGTEEQKIEVEEGFLVVTKEGAKVLLS